MLQKYNTFEAKRELKSCGVPPTNENLRYLFVCECPYEDLWFPHPDFEERMHGMLSPPMSIRA